MRPWVLEQVVPAAAFDGEKSLVLQQLQTDQAIAISSVLAVFPANT